MSFIEKEKIGEDFKMKIICLKDNTIISLKKFDRCMGCHPSEDRCRTLKDFHETFGVGETLSERHEEYYKIALVRLRKKKLERILK